MQIQLLAVCSVFAAEICEHLTTRAQVKLANAGTIKLMILVQFSEFAVRTRVPLAFAGPSFVETLRNSSRRRCLCRQAAPRARSLLRNALLFFASRVVEPGRISDACKTDRWSAANAASDMILTHCSALSGPGNEASTGSRFGEDAPWGKFHVR